ncbi:MAG: ferritin-like domain-containing protein [Acidimicrobiaceae bacterium]|nr:ferritin-like domain-containing protein [Acidimicrobiaceae bacterium]
MKPVNAAPDCQTARSGSAVPAPARSHTLNRRAVLGGGTLGAAAAALGALTPLTAFAKSTPDVDSLTQYFDILATGEALFTTFYQLAVFHHRELGLRGASLDAIKAIATEEEIHLRLAQAQGGTPATLHFSFPDGAATFRDIGTFLRTQQLAEELTNGALNAWVNDMATNGQARLAQLGAQLQQVEGGHRVVGRVLAGADPYDNWGFGPIVLNSFLQVPQAVTAAGFLSPRPGNDFPFTPAPAFFPGVGNTTPGPL